MIGNISLSLCVGILCGLYIGFAVGVTHEPVQIVTATTCPTAEQVMMGSYRGMFAELK